MADVESEADRFASELLFPGSSLKLEWPSAPTLSAFMPLKYKWGLSLQAIIQLGYFNGLITEERRSSLFKQLSSRKWPDGTRWREKEPGFDVRDPETPRLLGKMAEVGLGNSVRMDTISHAVGNWPPLLLQQLIGNQIRPSMNSTPADENPNSGRRERATAKVLAFPSMRRSGGAEKEDFRTG